MPVVDGFGIPFIKKSITQTKKKKNRRSRTPYVLACCHLGRLDALPVFFEITTSRNNEVRNKTEQITSVAAGVCKVSIKRTSGCTVVLFFPQIYDTATGHKILTLHDSNNTNNYSKNLASFNPTDDLVLNDGVLWDVKGKRVIHKFDKFNNFVSGVFHPSGLEIIINSEIVSLKNYHSLTSLFLFITDSDNRPFAGSDHILRNKFCWDAHNAVGL